MTQYGQLELRMLDLLQQYPGVKRYWVAFSGGIDSLVLLRLLAQHQHQFEACSVHAVYINHGLSPQADEWSRRCGQVCKQLTIPFQAIDVDATPLPGESPEAKAREVRYNALLRLVREGDCLLTAHHQDDQLETLLLQLMRGSGPKGLAAMPLITSFGKGCHLRPLLTSSRDEIHAYALMHKLKWVEDESNQDVRFDRNFLRHEIIPILKRRRPSLLQTANRTARLCAEATELLEIDAQRLIKSLLTETPGQLNVEGLSHLRAAQKRNVLRYWIQSLGFPLPSEAQLNSVITSVVDAVNDAAPVARWQRCEIRRYREFLYIMPPLATHNSARVITWGLGDPLEVCGVGKISAQKVSGEGVAAKYITHNNTTIRFRQGGEKIKPLGCSHHRALKKLLQEKGIVPWLRERIPLLYIGDKLAMVGQLFVDEAFKAGKAEQGYLVHWQPDDI